MFQWVARRKKARDKELLAIFRELSVQLKRSTDSPYSGLDVAALISILEQQSRNISSGFKVNYKQLKAIFVPTGPLQEVSIYNAWSDSFITLADRYDSATFFRH